MIIIYFLIFFTILVLYGYRGITKLTIFPALRSRKRFLHRGYLAVNLLFIVFTLIWIIIIRSSNWPDHVQYRNYFYISGTFVVIYGPLMVYLLFILPDDIRTGLVWMFQRTTSLRVNPVYGYILPAIGGFFAVMIFILVLHGIFVGRFNYKVEQVEIYFEDLPESFDGYRLVHFSDTHLGSYARQKPVIRGLEIISGLRPDVVIFSGDLINNQETELIPYTGYFQNIFSRDGKYGVLGNHDMGDYRRWYTIEEKEPDLRKLESIQQSSNFTLLRNEHIFIRRGNDSIMIAGVDNWGLPPFEQAGDLNAALGINREFPFKILISHDPSHWRAEIMPHTDIDLTLSGHTHGMQIGISTRWFSWSPSVFMYPEWGGKYRIEKQVLYVNRGFGFLGIPMRIGMPPEITEITLRKQYPS
jgi:uncharacterized protein